MKALLIEGFTDAYRSLGAAVKLFWPAVLAYLAAIAVSAVFGFYAVADSTAGLVAFLFIALAAIVYSFLALCQGAVGWHRRILLNEAAGWISPVPRLRGLKYAGAVFAFGLIFLAGHMFISYFTLPYLHSVFTSPLGDIDLTHAPVEQLEIWRKAVWPIQIATFATAVVLVSAVLWFGRSWLFVFPHISIRSGQPAFGLIRESLHHPVGLVGALLIAFFLPSLLGLIFYVTTPMSVQFLPVVRGLYVILGIALSALCFLAGLSILSRAYAKAAKGKVPYEGTGDVAPA